MTDGTIRILIAASGSGGHLFPAIFIAEAIKLAASPREVEVRFIGSGRPLESQLIDSRGYTRYEVKLKGITGRGVKGWLQFIVAAPKACLAVWQILSSFRPALVIGVGGYASFLPVTLASLRGTPTLIHEAELSPGLANKVLARYATKITAAFSALDLNRKKQVHTGHPLRPELLKVTERTPEQGPPKHLLILGGSQGAKALDEVMGSLLDLLKRHEVEIHHQTRPENLQEIAAKYKLVGIKASVTSFFDDMVGEYSWSDLIISRSGAAAVTEIDFVGRPAIFVPLPTSQGGHQLANAKYVSAKGRAVVVTEGPDFVTRMTEELSRFLSPEHYSRLLTASRPPPISDAAHLIAQEALKSIHHR